MLAEQFRPKSWEDVVGQDKAIAKIRALQSRSGLGGRAYWLSGSSGTGKTTIAMLIAAELAERINRDGLAAALKAYRDVYVMCCCCGAELTDPVSRQRGIGPG